MAQVDYENYVQVVCYPRGDREEFAGRLEEMKELGVLALCFEGEKIVANQQVLGKGCVGIVILAVTNQGKVALKIRRTDANRSAMRKEAEMLQIANSVNVGPRLLAYTKNFLTMEFVNGRLIPDWLESITPDKNGGDRLRRVFREVLEQSWSLDEVGLDHGELSQASKHVMIDIADKVYLLDFETASATRRVANVTSICHYLFIKEGAAEMLQELLGRITKEEIVEVLRTYKTNRTRQNFERILKVCSCWA